MKFSNSIKVRCHDDSKIEVDITWWLWRMAWCDQCPVCLQWHTSSPVPCSVNLSHHCHQHHHNHHHYYHQLIMKWKMINDDMTHIITVWRAILVEKIAYHFVWFYPCMEYGQWTCWSDPIDGWNSEGWQYPSDRRDPLDPSWMVWCGLPHPQGVGWVILLPHPLSRPPSPEVTISKWLPEKLRK